MIHVTCRLTAKNRDQLRNPTLGNRVWATFTFFTFLCEKVGLAVRLCNMRGERRGDFFRATKLHDKLRNEIARVTSA